MAHRRDLIATAEHSVGIGQGRAQFKEGIAHFFLTDRVPIRNLEITGKGLPGLDRVLQ
ncbi:hypothetical protein D3C76_1481100 [compost metagenome]